MRPRGLAALALTAALVTSTTACGDSDDRESLTVLAAASLTEAFTRIGSDYPIVALTDAASPTEFVAYVGSAPARAVLTAAGFQQP